MSLEISIHWQNHYKNLWHKHIYHLQKFPPALFIYNSNMGSNQIETITSSINILPTVINLFGIDNEYLYTGYDALSTNDEYVIFRDYTYYDGKDILPLTQVLLQKLEYSSDLLLSDYYKNGTKK